MSFAVDFTKSYAKRRQDEPRSHYAERLKFINELRKGNFFTTFPPETSVFLWDHEFVF
jgi:hypothetical protein